MTSWGMKYDFLGKCQHTPTEEVKSSCAKINAHSNQCSKLEEIQSNNIVEDHRFKPKINWSKTVNQNTSFEK